MKAQIIISPRLGSVAAFFYQRNALAFVESCQYVGGNLSVCLALPVVGYNGEFG